MSLAIVVRELRERRALSQRELAAKAGVAKQTVVAIETGLISEPWPKTLRRLASALGVDPSVLSTAHELVPLTEFTATAPALPRAAMPGARLDLASHREFLAFARDMLGEMQRATDREDLEEARRLNALLRSLTDRYQRNLDALDEGTARTQRNDPALTSATNQVSEAVSERIPGEDITREHHYRPDT